MNAIDEPQLSLDEWNCLRDAEAGGCLQKPWPRETLARLEGLGLLMRGWGNTYVLTAAGHAALEQGPPPLRPRS